MRLATMIAAATCALAACGGGGSEQTSADANLQSLVAMIESPKGAFSQPEQAGKKQALKTVNCSEMDNTGCGAGTDTSTYSGLMEAYGGGIDWGYGPMDGRSWEPVSPCADMECPSCICNGPAPTRRGIFAATPYKCIAPVTVYRSSTGVYTGTYKLVPVATGSTCYGTNPSSWTFFVPKDMQAPGTAAGTYK